MMHTDGCRELIMTKLGEEEKGAGGIRKKQGAGKQMDIEEHPRSGRKG